MSLKSLCMLLSTAFRCSWICKLLISLCKSLRSWSILFSTSPPRSGLGLCVLRWYNWSAKQKKKTVFRKKQKHSSKKMLHACIQIKCILCYSSILISYLLRLPCVNEFRNIRYFKIYLELQTMNTPLTSLICSL